MEIATTSKTQPKRNNSATFVLVHGGWHGSWCWARVRRRLSELAAGYFDAPELEEAYHQPQQYFLGDALLDLPASAFAIIVRALWLG